MTLLRFADGPIPSFDATYNNVSLSPVKIRLMFADGQSEALLFYHRRWT
jgi:hypothetical protein